MAIQMVSRYGFDAVKLTNRNCPGQALIARQGARPLAFWPKGESSGFTALATNREKPARSTHVCWPNFGRLSFNRDGSDIQLNEKGVPADGGIYGQYSLEAYGLGHQIMTLPMHGPSRTEDWTIVQPSENEALLVYKHLPDRNYPYYSELLAKAAITDDGSFLYSFMATNPQAKRMFMDLAIHTYLTWLPGMTVDGIEGLEYFEGSDWTRSDGSETLQAHETRFEPLTALEKHCLLDGKGTFDIGYPSAGQMMRYEVFGEPVHPEQMVLWANPDEGAFLCMEPVLRGRNSLNDGSAYALRQGHNVSVGFSLKSLA